ncbi:MAG: hypothetical protein LBJ86_03980 [Spirochaetaceae bacterium]|jgi:hypothetical protein|nr:hypothetical protein [Spirochaetaceae bacterium]
MRKKSNLLGIPAGLLVLGLVLAGCDHGPAPVPPVTEGIDVEGEYELIGEEGSYLLYSGGLKIGQAGTDGIVNWEKATSVFKQPSLGKPAKFRDVGGSPLGEIALVLNGEEQPGGFVIQIYETQTGKATGLTGVWIGIGGGTASIAGSLSSSKLQSFAYDEDIPGVESIINQQATAAGTLSLVGKK